MARITVVSPGALGAHPLRGEKGDHRPAHATTTLVESEGRKILVDPSLPAAYLAPRLDERAGIKPEAITDVFLTDLRALRRRGLAACTGARVCTFELELETSMAWLQEKLDEAEEAGDDDTAAAVNAEMEVLRNIEVADDKLARGVDLFPLPGVTNGLCGLLVSVPGGTILIAGDAVPTAEHLEGAVVLAPAFDVKQAQESLREAVEIADAIVCGRDGLVLNPMRGSMSRGMG